VGGNAALQEQEKATMNIRRRPVGGSVDVVVVGAGQAGLAVSYYLRAFGVEHLVLERGRVGESWRSTRWDSFTLVTPNWMTRLPGHALAPGTGADFIPRDAVAGLLETFAEGLPVTGVWRSSRSRRMATATW
jgi:putative flavoprotein involved in K+ transport